MQTATDDAAADNRRRDHGADEARFGVSIHDGQTLVSLRDFDHLEPRQLRPLSQICR